MHEEPEPEPEPPQPRVEEDDDDDDDETELLSRSSIDSVADEVQRTIRNQVLAKPPPTAAAAAATRTRVHKGGSRYSLTVRAAYIPPRSGPGSCAVVVLCICAVELPPAIATRECDGKALGQFGRGRSTYGPRA